MPTSNDTSALSEVALVEASASTRASQQGNPKPDTEAFAKPDGDISRPVLQPLRLQDDEHLDAAPAEPIVHEYIVGWRLYAIIFGLCLSLFLSTLETTIVSTSLISITNALHGFE
ncbi:major facilitator superfamily transporter [Colletotrichum incanum]|uniref:Major facilitator superfamily transporter n=1 Tax=Colletotrichum incanum TaxID=1573173 RepID=A0A162MZW8_COLIC|nr:major facilitator superfamily transporter [Colletotrichum incanum]